jgi:hypothetical protein
MRFVCYEKDLNGEWRPSMDYRPPATAITDELKAPELGLVLAWIDTAAHGDIRAVGEKRVLIALDEDLFNSAFVFGRIKGSKPATVAEVVKPDPEPIPQTVAPPVVIGGGHSVADAPDKITRPSHGNQNPASGGLFG